jgi:hypothetical protein
VQLSVAGRHRVRVSWVAAGRRWSALPRRGPEYRSTRRGAPSVPDLEADNRELRPRNTDLQSTARAQRDIQASRSRPAWPRRPLRDRGDNALGDRLDWCLRLQAPAGNCWLTVMSGRSETASLITERSRMPMPARANTAPSVLAGSHHRMRPDRASGRYGCIVFGSTSCQAKFARGQGGSGGHAARANACIGGSGAVVCAAASRRRPRCWCPGR